jgi:hypothetical protein
MKNNAQERPNFGERRRPPTSPYVVIKRIQVLGCNLSPAARSTPDGW